jgi:hypothetical protein
MPDALGTLTPRAADAIDRCLAALERIARWPETELQIFAELEAYLADPDDQSV